VASETRADQFGRKLKAARDKRGLTQEELGKLSGFSVSYIYRLENGNREPRLSTIADLAKALKLDPTDLIKGIR